MSGDRDLKSTFPHLCKLAVGCAVLLVGELLSGYALLGAHADPSYVARAVDPTEYWHSIVLHTILLLGVVIACVFLRWRRDRFPAEADIPPAKRVTAARSHQKE